MYGKTLVIVNPAAQSGKASQVAAHAASVLNHIKTKTANTFPEYRFYYTVKQNDATEITQKEGANYQTLFVIGGDGVIHEVINGLMALPRSQRPRLGIVPCGNGNDFARTIGMDRDPKKALQRLESHVMVAKQIDVARANTSWFVETMSFGLDAAIALGTQELRKKTKRTGTSLYLQCGIDQLKNHRDVHTCTLSLDGGDPQTISCYLLAVQNGPHYGGGFKVCPQARLNDGKLDICYATPTLSFGAAIKVFMQAKNGNHTHHPHLHFAQAQKVEIAFKKPLPIQIDGERFTDTTIIIKAFPGELEVYIPE